MAVDGHITLPNGVWTQLGSADISKFTLIHVSGRDVLFRGVAGNVTPEASTTTGLRLAAGVDAAQSGLIAKTLADLTPRGNATRLFARPDGVGTSRVYFANDTDFEGAMAAVEVGVDTLAAAGININLGDLAVTEVIDVLVAAGIVLIQGDFAVTEAADDVLAAESVDIRIDGDLVVTEAGDDVIAAVGGVLVEGVLAATETLDVLQTTGIVFDFGNMDVTEAIDVLAAAGISINFGALAVTEAIDVLAATGDTRIDGDLVVTEGIDVLAADGELSA